MWSYYGAKTNLVNLYPPPKYSKIIEPFAGTARYALKYFDREVLLVDKYPVIVEIWKYLQSCSEKDILSLPRTLNSGEYLHAITFDCEAQKNFYGFIVGCGADRPRMKAPDRKTAQRPNHINYNLQRVAKNLFKIKHWEIQLGTFEDIPNQPATWFIDPPYEFGGEAYVMSNKKINFSELGIWCRNRGGQIIVCENTKATWMDFKPIMKQRGSLKSTTEAIWSNEKTHYDNIQQTLF